MRLQGKRIAILVGPGYEDLEFWVPLMRLQEEGAEVTVVGIRADEGYTSKSGGLKQRRRWRRTRSRRINSTV